MAICKKCDNDKKADEFYKNDTTCKECRKQKVRENRARNAEYYRAYDRQRANRPDRVAARQAYQETEAGQLAADRAKRRYIQRHPVKRAAHVILGNAIRDGKVIKPGFCEGCGGTGRIHGHHDDYAEPLKVRWLCSPCHRQWHTINGEAKNAG